MSEGIEQAPVRWLDEGTGRSPEQLGLVLQAQGSQNFVNGTVLCGVCLWGLELLSPSDLPSHLGSETSKLCGSGQGTQPLWASVPY